MGRKSQYPAITEADKLLIDRLSDAHQAILALQDQTYDAIAAALHIPGGTVRSRLHRARAALKRLRDRESQSQQSHHTAE